MKINNIEFKDWVYLLFFIFTVFTLIFNTRITAININKKFNFETKTKKAEKFREKFSELLTILDSIKHIHEERREKIEKYTFGFDNYDKAEKEMYEKINDVKRKINIHVNYLCLMIEDQGYFILKRDKTCFKSNWHLRFA